MDIGVNGGGYVIDVFVYVDEFGVGVGLLEMFLCWKENVFEKVGFVCIYCVVEQDLLRVGRW